MLTAESGWMSGLVPYGPPKVAEMRRAIDEHRAAEGLPPVEWDESTESKTNDGGADEPGATGDEDLHELSLLPDFGRRVVGTSR